MAKIFVTLGLVVFLVGCGNKCLIDSDPTGADVVFDGEKVGQTPVKVGIGRNKFSDTYPLEVSKPGYETNKQEVKGTYDAWKGTQWPRYIKVTLKKVGEEKEETKK